MSFRAIQSLQCSLKHAGARASPRLAASAARTRVVVGRRFASGGAHGAPSSDLPWLIGSIAVTIPAAYYLWPSESHADHGHHDSHAEHDDSHADESEEKEEDAEEEPKEESKEESKDEEESKGDDESSDDSEEKVEDGTSDVDGVDFKGKTKDGKQDTRKVEDDSKGAKKKRIDSGLGRNLGEEADDTETNENAATAKTPKKGSTEITGKQFGLSTTATRHSFDDERMSELSHKGEGTPDTAKAMGTVDPKRDQK